MIIVTQSQLRNKDTESMLLLRNEIKAGFKLIYNTMLATKDFHKAINVIFGVRKHNLMCAQDMIRILRAKYDKEKHDYIHAVLNNNSIN